MSDIYTGLEAAFESLKRGSIEAMKPALSEVYEQFQSLQRKQSKIDRDTFNIDFDFKLFLSKMDDVVLADELPEIITKFQSLLPKIKAYADKNNKKELKNKEAMLEKVEKVEIIEEVVKAVKAPPLEAPIVLGSMADFSLGTNSVNQVNLIIAEQHEINFLLKEAGEKVTHALHEAELAEKTTVRDANKVLEQTHLLKEIEAKIETTSSTERQERNKLAEILRQFGFASANMGQMQRIRAEFMAANGRMHNALVEVRAAEYSANAVVEFISSPAVRPGAALLEIFEQIKQTKVTLEQAINTSSIAMEQLESISSKAQATLEFAEKDQQLALSAQQQADALVLESEQVSVELQKNFLSQQKILFECLALAAESRKISDNMRAQAQDAIQLQKKLTIERARVADRVRVSIQEAAELERSRIFSELMSKGEIANI